MFTQYRKLWERLERFEVRRANMLVLGDQIGYTPGVMQALEQCERCIAELCDDILALDADA